MKSLLALVLVPLVVGLFTRSRYPAQADHWQEGLVRIANLALAIALSTGIAGNWDTIKALIGSWVIVVTLVIVMVAGALGALSALLGGNRDTCVTTTVGLVSTLRFGSLGLIIIGSQLGGCGIPRTSDHLRVGRLHPSVGLRRREGPSGCG